MLRHSHLVEGAGDGVGRRGFWRSRHVPPSKRKEMRFLKYQGPIATPTTHGRRRKAHTSRLYRAADLLAFWDRSVRVVQAWQGHIARRPSSPAGSVLGWRMLGGSARPRRSAPTLLMRSLGATRLAFGVGCRALRSPSVMARTGVGRGWTATSGARPSLRGPRGVRSRTVQACRAGALCRSGARELFARGHGESARALRRLQPVARASSGIRCPRCRHTGSMGPRDGLGDMIGVGGGASRDLYIGRRPCAVALVAGLGAGAYNA